MQNRVEGLRETTHPSQQESYIDPDQYFHFSQFSQHDDATPSSFILHPVETEFDFGSQPQFGMAEIDAMRRRGPVRNMVATGGGRRHVPYVDHGRPSAVTPRESRRETGDHETGPRNTAPSSSSNFLQHSVPAAVRQLRPHDATPVQTAYHSGISPPPPQHASTSYNPFDALSSHARYSNFNTDLPNHPHNSHSAFHNPIAHPNPDFNHDPDPFAYDPSSSFDGLELETPRAPTFDSFDAFDDDPPIEPPDSYTSAFKPHDDFDDETDVEQDDDFFDPLDEAGDISLYKYIKPSSGGRDDFALIGSGLGGDSWDVVGGSRRDRDPRDGHPLGDGEDEDDADGVVLTPRARDHRELHVGS